MIFALSKCFLPYFGFVAVKENGKVIIKKVEPNSVTDKNGIAPEDEITKVNGKKIEGDLSEILKGCKDDVTFTIKKKFSEKSISLAIGNYYQLLELLNALLDMVVLPATTIKTDKQHLYGCMIYNILQSIQCTHCITSKFVCKYIHCLYILPKICSII